MMNSSVQITFRKKKYTIVRSINSDLVPVIKELAASLLHGAYISSKRYYELKAIRTISNEAYQNIVLIDPSLDMDKLEDKESEDWKLHQHYYELEKDSLHTKYVEMEKKLDLKIQKVDKAINLYRKIRPVRVYSRHPITYPEVPTDKFSIDDPSMVPDVSGIYFVWLHDICEYVGQSKNIRNRVCSKGHQKITLVDKLSYLPFDKSDLNFAESYYIGIMRPRRNFMSID